MPIKTEDKNVVLRSTIDSLPFAYFLINEDLALIENNRLLPEIFSVNKINDFADIVERFNGAFLIRERCMAVLHSMEAEVFEDISVNNKFLKIYLQPVCSSDGGDKIGLLGIVEDTTVRTSLERSKEDFFSIASHELRAPLVAIKGNTSMILEFFGTQLPDKEVTRMIEDINEASVRLLKIVSDFLDVSRLEQGEVVLNLEKMDLVELTKEIARDFSSMAMYKGLSLKISDISTDTFVIGDIEIK